MEQQGDRVGGNAQATAVVEYSDPYRKRQELERLLAIVESHQKKSNGKS